VRRSEEEADDEMERTAYRKKLEDERKAWERRMVGLAEHFCSFWFFCSRHTS
jgi:hypothetical protein